MRKIPIDGKIIFISTVDCGYGQNLARILATNGAIVLGGCVDPTADSVSNLRDYSIYLVKFETSTDEKIEEGIGRVKLRSGFKTLPYHEPWNKMIESGRFSMKTSGSSG